jgi:hypothetical protein
MYEGALLPKSLLNTSNPNSSDCDDYILHFANALVTAEPKLSQHNAHRLAQS